MQAEATAGTPIAAITADSIAPRDGHRERVVVMPITAASRLFTNVFLLSLSSVPLC
jgi:hypothetical protein